MASAKPGMDSHQFREKTISSVGWNATARLATNGLKFIVTVILARLLSPEAFGLVAMVTVFVNFAASYTELGFGDALIHKQDCSSAHYSSIFWLNVLAGLLLTAVFMACSPLIAAFYHEPVLIPLTLVIAPQFVLNALKVVQHARLRKHLEFRKLAFIHVAALTASGTVAIVMALSGFGVWSLVAHTLLLTAVTVLLLWLLSDWRPTLVIDWQAVRELASYSANVVGFSSLNYWARHADNLLIGRFVGTFALGIYSRAYSLMMLPLRIVSRSIGQVAFPALSVIQTDQKRVRELYLRVTRSTALVSFPMMVGLLIIADVFVLVVFGEKWAAMIPIVRILSIVGLHQSITTLEGSLYRSQGRADLQFRVGLVQSALTVIAIVLGLRWGLMGVALCYGGYSILSGYVTTAIAGHVVKLPLRRIVLNLLPVFACAVGMGAAVYATDQVLPSALPVLAKLAILITSGGASYLFIIHIAKLNAYVEICDIVAERWQRTVTAKKGMWLGIFRRRGEHSAL